MSDDVTVRAQRIELVDDSGGVRVLLGKHDSPSGESFGVEVCDGEGRPRLWLALEPEGPVLVFDQAGNLALHAGVNDPTSDAVHVGVFMYLYDRQGTPVLGWRVEQDGVVTRTE